MSSVRTEPPKGRPAEPPRLRGGRPGGPGAAPPRRRRVPAQIVCLGYMMLIIAASIGVDRAIAYRLFTAPGRFVPAYRSFQDYDVGVKLQQFRGVEDERWSGFFIGNSRTMFGVNPVVFDHALARRRVHSHTYNLAEESVDVRFWQPFFTRYYGRHPPHYLFLGVLPRDFDAGYTALGTQYIQAFFASAGFENRNMSTINRAGEEALSHMFYLKGRASDLRLVTLSDIVHGRKLDLNGGTLANRQGWMELPRSVQEIPKRFLRAQARKLAHRPGTVPFRMGTAQRESLIRLNSWVRGGGGCLILFTTRLYYDLEQWGTELMRRGFTEAMHRLTRQVPGLQFDDV